MMANLVSGLPRFELGSAAPGFAELRAGNLGVRLAVAADELDAAQALRYRVFYQEMGAHPTMEMALAQRDFDDFDRVCDHLLVIDQAKGAGGDAVVGTYRLIRRSAARRHASNIWRSAFCSIRRARRGFASCSATDFIAWPPARDGTILRRASRLRR